MSAQASKVINLKVITLQNGEEIGKVKDVLYSPQEKIVKALLIRDKGLFNDAEVILTEDIKSIGDDAVIVQSEAEIKKADEVDENTRQLTASHTFLTQTDVMTENGTELGEISDIYFNVPSGGVEAFEVSQGGLNTLAQGKKRITVSDIVTVGKDHVIVRSYTEAQFARQEGGVSGTVNQAARSAKRKAPEVWDDIRAKAGALGGAAASTYQDVKSNPKTQQFLKKARQKTSQIKDEASETAAKIRQKAETASNSAELPEDEQIVTQDDGTITMMPKNELDPKNRK